MQTHTDFSSRQSQITRPYVDQTDAYSQKWQWFFGQTFLGALVRAMAMAAAALLIIFWGSLAIASVAENNFEQTRTRLESDIDRITADIDRVAQSLQETDGQVAALDEQIAALEDDISTTDLLLEETRDIVRDLNISIQNKETEKRRMEHLLTQILRDLHIAQRQGIVQTLLTSQNVGEAISTMYQFTQLAQYTSNLREDIVRIEQELTSQKQQQQDAEIILEDTKSVQQSRKDSLEILLRQTQNSQQRYLELLEALEGQGVAKQREIEAVEIEEQQGQRVGQNPIDGECLVNAETKPITVPSGYFVRPMAGRISQEFGCYDDHIHDGYDIAAGIGVPVYSSAQGMIVRMRSGCVNGGYVWCNGGLGNYIIIQHDLPSGDRVFTVYAHLTSFENLNEGFAVGQRTLLGYNGCTGNTFPRPCGPHLHFSIISADFGTNCNRMYGPTRSKCYDPSKPPFDIF